MFQQKLTNFKQIPTKQSQRKLTDVICTIVGGAFALIMFIIAIILIKVDNFFLSNYPTDSDHLPCAYRQNSQYAFLYFPDVKDINQRVCVSSCPQKNDKQLICRPNKAVPSCLSVTIYDTQPNFKRLGGFCVPKDSNLKEILIKTTGLNNKWKFLNTYDSIRLCLLLSPLVGLIWLIFVQMSPRYMSIIAIITATIVSATTGILLLVDSPNGWEGKNILRIIIGSAFLITTICLLLFLFLYRRRVKLSGILLNQSVQFLSQKCITIIYIPIFIILTIGLIILCLFQHLSYSSHNTPIVDPTDIYLRVNSISILEILNVIEFIWGAQFLKDSFNFMISGNSSQWYVKTDQNFNCYSPCLRYFKYNFGSVVGGSFLNAFFNFIDFIFEVFRCYPGGICPSFAPCCSICSQSCGCFFDLVRTDAYSYINLTGIPYCNAAKNCQVLCHQTDLFIGSQSCIFFYRLCAHITCVGFLTLIGYWIMKQKINGINIASLIVIIILVYCIVTYFIDLHADAAEGIQVSYLLERLLTTNINELIHQFKSFKGELKGMQKSYNDGQC